MRPGLPDFIENLRAPRGYPHPAGEVRVIETHISWVLLAGEFAYKIKKPVNLGFVDFSTLEQRRFFCHEELRLNRRLAPALYLDVVGIHGTPDAPCIGPEAGGFEVAVKMRAFDESMRFDALIERDALTPERVTELGAKIAAFHAVADIAPAGSAYGSAQAILAPVAQNFAQIGVLLESDAGRTELREVEGWSLAEHARLRAAFEARRAGGFVRECHGDLHLGNIALVDGAVTPFDALEFSAPLRWIDVMSEMAFLRMDFDLRGRADFAARVLDAWLEASGDFAGLRVLPFYEVYRAMVRAKVARMRAAQLRGAARDTALGDYARHQAWARTRIRTVTPALVITHGLSGSGKSFAALMLAEQSGAVRVRSDVERKRLAGLAAGARSGSDMNDGLYSKAMTQATYDRLEACARDIVEAGYTAIVDAAFLKGVERERMRALADELGVPFRILACTAPRDELERRIRARSRAGRDASEATPQVLDMQERWLEPLDAREWACVLTMRE